MYFLLGLFLGGLMVYSYYSTQPVQVVYKTKLTAKQQTLLDLISSKTKVSNSQVQKLLKVSDATATRYLDELEQAGEIQQVGKTGRSVYYAKK